MIHLNIFLLQVESSNWYFNNHYNLFMYQLNFHLNKIHPPLICITLVL
jgi:hypothetical protein